MTAQTQTQAANITAFLTIAGIDLVLRKDGVQYRARVTYDAMQAELDGKIALVDLTDDDEVLAVSYDGLDLELKLQPKGHYFAWLQSIERADACDISEARRLLRNAARSKAKASKPAVTQPAPF